jgi:hypothetical protein
MADVPGKFFSARKVRTGVSPSSPGVEVGSTTTPVNPPGTSINSVGLTMPTAFTVANSPLTSNGTIAVTGAGTSSQFIKGDGTLDSTAYGTGTVTSVALTMPTAFSVANSPVTTAGTLAVTATGTTSQYIRGDGSLETFPALTGFVPYTGATADVNLGTHDLAAERGTFANNGSSDTLTVNHTSGSGYGIIVTKGGNNEALYVSKTSGSGNAMTVVGGRTSLVDLALSSVTNTAGDFLTLSGGVVHKRTAAQTLTDIGGQAALTNPVTGTGTSGTLPKFTGSTTIGNSQVIDNGTQVAVGQNPNASYGTLQIKSPSSAYTLDLVGRDAGLNSDSQISFWNSFQSSVLASIGNSGSNLYLATGANQPFTLSSGGNFIFGSTTDAGFKLDVNGTGRFTSSVALGQTISVVATNGILYHSTNNNLYIQGGSDGLAMYSDGGRSNSSIVLDSGTKAVYLGTNSVTRLSITSAGIVDISGPLVIRGTLPADQTDAAVIDHFSNTMRIFSYGAAGVTGDFEFRTAAGGAGSNLVSTINGTTGAYTDLSDINKKKDFEESTIGLGAILGLKPTLYRMKSETNTQKHLGFIAQEVRQYIPNAYVENGEFIGLNQMPIIAALVKSIQELNEKIK